ncbi:uncharacterized protein BDV17DRAFT_38524 [Aspergillus undulatus]|uniref:uncharacterized protein n=1 Tax=Aspergillus undulatus TaxID=1810928 RepID=UPI003CCDD014
MHTSKVSSKALKEYNRLVEDTSYNLNIYLRRIDEKLAQLHDENINIFLEKERAVGKQCLRICEIYLGSWTNREPSLLQGLPQNTAGEDSVQERFETQQLKRQALEENQKSFSDMIVRLQERMADLVINSDPKDGNERRRLQEELDISKHCLKVCQVASEVPPQKIFQVVEEDSDGDSDQVVVTTLADLFDVEKALSTGKLAQFRCSMERDIQQLATKRFENRFRPVVNTSGTSEGSNTSPRSSHVSSPPGRPNEQAPLQRPSQTQIYNKLFTQGHMGYTQNPSNLSTKTSAFKLPPATSRISTPEAEGFTLDSGIPRTENLDFIINPISYNEALCTLEIDTARFCGLHKMDLRTRVPVATVNLEECLSILEGCQNAFHNLRCKGFCGTVLTVLTENPHQPGIAQAIQISLGEIESLINQLRGDIGHEPSEPSVQLVQQLAAKLFTQDIILETGGKFSSFLNSICRALPLGIVSFAGSHTCAFDVNSWGQEINDISVGFGYNFSRRQLACLNEFIGGPVWVLSSAKRMTDSPGMMVCLTVKEFQQLWGPVWIVGGTETMASMIRTERGYIIPVSRDKQTVNLPNGVFCHWTKDLPGSFLQDESLKGRIFTDTESRLVIGLDEDEHGKGITVNTKCRADINLIQRQIAGELKLPGTCKSHYIGEGYEVNITGGYQANLGLTKKWKRMPARTHKSMLVAYCASPTAELLPCLNLRVGLEVSACTGNSRRVNLWDVIQLSRARKRAENAIYTQIFCDHAIGSIECINRCWAKDGRHSLDEVINMPGDAAHTIARREVIHAILALEHTGLDNNGWLQAFWPFSHCPQVCRISPGTGARKNNWLRVVKDTPDTSTFAVLSQRCLGVAYSFSNVCLSGCFQQYIAQPLPTALCTQVFIENPNARMNKEMKAGDHLRIGEISLKAVGTRSGDTVLLVATVRKTQIPSWFDNGIRIQEYVCRDNLVNQSLLMITY